jgi:hypothetical protein
MDNIQLKAILMALMSPTATGRELNPAEIKFLSANADKLLGVK